jgi:4-cresol dehydrogenase (hydroxylating)
LGRLTILTEQKVSILKGLIRANEKGTFLPLVNLFKNAFVSPAPMEVIEVMPDVYDVLRGIPGERIVGCAYFKHRDGRPKTDINPARDGCGLIWFAPVVPLQRDHIDRVLQLCQPLFKKFGIDFSMSFILVNPRSVVMLMEIFYDKQDSAETARAKQLYDELCTATFAADYQQYRTSVTWMNRLFEESPSYQKFVNAIKPAVDPQGILAPGRYGVIG